MPLRESGATVAQMQDRVNAGENVDRTSGIRQGATAIADIEACLFG
ncbi:hypothetical protein MRS76_01420 [Rhizobiaceae bacterium n13]|uniref:Uncharacterized protein n=1 Tax=Ferirhizobium litorale TaxID=2927786 RepID=A0AAE3QCC3_9HYPH|nr:hypothetical protein [Fererhizobium litorale]MDI7860603.1 hypothetical protein [Fererhizobium litorale]MDI7920751.1 hypothetical protein [Fererhizobium litorale]